ncbi:MAG: hypothetical protein OXC26_13105 [Albidovulum sp.]|nr:hypothetical protein [Albidovulum sp.]
MYNQRWQIENCIAKIKESRAIATRYVNSAEHYAAIHVLAAGQGLSRRNRGRNGKQWH